MVQKHASGLESFYSLLTPRIMADLPSWYGSEAHLVGEPTFHPRPWSYFFRYIAKVSDTDTKALLVKIRHTEGMGISEAIASGKISSEAALEFESLMKIGAVFSAQEEASIFASIQPLAFYDEFNAVVTEEADIRALRSSFQSIEMWGRKKSHKAFEVNLYCAGRWLRVFHDQVGKVEEGPFFSEEHYRETLENLGMIEMSIPYSDLSFVRSLITGLYQKYGGAILPQRNLHGDFNLANIFVTRNGRICSFDPKNNPGPIYVDLAKLITDMKTCRPQILTWGRHVTPSLLKVYNAALLKGYFGEEPMSFAALNLYRLTHLIEKWAESEAALKGASGMKKVLYAVGVLQMRSYFMQLLRKQAVENE